MSMNPPAAPGTERIATIPAKYLLFGALGIGALVLFVVRAKSSSMGSAAPASNANPAPLTPAPSASAAPPMPYTNQYSDAVVNITNSAIGQGASEKYDPTSTSTSTSTTSTIVNPNPLPPSSPAPQQPAPSSPPSPVLNGGNPPIGLPQVPVDMLAGLDPNDPRKKALYSQGQWYQFQPGDTPENVAQRFGTPFGWTDIAYNPLNAAYLHAIYLAQGNGGVPTGAKVWVP